MYIVYTNLKLSSSEMCLTRYFGLIVGDLVPENDDVWQLFIYLRQIIDIVISPRIIENDTIVLKNLIEKHHKCYLKLFGALKPKMHLMLHYPKILLEIGPFTNFWSM